MGSSHLAIIIARVWDARRPPDLTIACHLSPNTCLHRNMPKENRFRVYRKASSGKRSLLLNLFQTTSSLRYWNAISRYSHGFDGRARKKLLQTFCQPGAIVFQEEAAIDPLRYICALR